MRSPPKKIWVVFDLDNGGHWEKQTIVSSYIFASETKKPLRAEAALFRRENPEARFSDPICYVLKEPKP